MVLQAVVEPYETHLGFRYMVASLRAHGFTSEIVFPSDECAIHDHESLLQRIIELRPRILGFTTYEGSLRELFAFIELVKVAGVDSMICLGGHLASFSYDHILRHHHHLIDVIVVGEGDESIVDLTRAVRDSTPLRAISGIALFEPGRVVVTGARPIGDIDQFPFPVVPGDGRWESADVPLFVTTSRGCFGRCSFCRSSQLGARWRSRDATSVVDELEAAVRLMAGVRSNLALIERIRSSEHLVYSDAFPFNELRAFPWAPVSRRLRDDGLLDGSEVQPRYRDPAVSELVGFVRRLRKRLPLAFKRRYLFDALASAGDAPIIDGATRAELLRVSEGLRAWIGLVVAPRFVGAACDAIEAAASPSEAKDDLDRLESEFAEETAILSPIERAMAVVLAGARS